MAISSFSTPPIGYRLISIQLSRISTLSIKHLLAHMLLCIMNVDNISGEASNMWILGEWAVVVIFGVEGTTGGSIS